MKMMIKKIKEVKKKFKINIKMITRNDKIYY